MQEITFWELRTDTWTGVSTDKIKIEIFLVVQQTFCSVLLFFFIPLLISPLHFHSLSFPCYMFLLLSLPFHFCSSPSLVDFQVNVSFLKHKHKRPWSPPGLDIYLKGRQELLLVPHRSSGFQHPSASLEQAVGEEEENQQQLKSKRWCCCAHGTQLESWLCCNRVDMKTFWHEVLPEVL